MIPIAERLNAIQPSPTIAVKSKATELQAAGRTIIDLGIGEPDFNTPEHIGQAGIQAIKAGKTKYEVVTGNIDLRKAICAKLARDNQLDYAPNDIIVTCGAKHALANAMQATINPGDEVIIPGPYWVSYPEMVRLAQAVPVTLETTHEQRFKITAEQLRAAITPKTRALIINSPSNPSGMSYSGAELQALAEVLLEHPNIFVISDDIYEHIQWTDEGFQQIASVCPQLKDRTITVNGVSKAYAMTGWRVGYAAAPQHVIKAMSKLQSQTTTGICSIAQYAATEALNGPQDSVHAMIKEFKTRHDYVVERLQAMPGVKVAPADGAFYAFPDVSAAISSLGLADDVALSTHLLENAGIAVVPGSAFGAPGCIRISYAASLEQLAQAMDLLQTSLA